MTDLTKILKVGDKLWDSRYGEVEVFLVNDTPYPITVSSKAGILSYTKDGRSTSLCEITLYPLDQKPAPPSWPDSPQTFEWEGEVYEKGEWVAVDYWNGFFFVRKLDFSHQLKRLF